MPPSLPNSVIKAANDVIESASSFAEESEIPLKLKRHVEENSENRSRKRSPKLKEPGKRSPDANSSTSIVLEGPKNSSKDCFDFCVMCELRLKSWSNHWKQQHSSNDCYCESAFEGTRVLAPRGADLAKELAKCPGCRGVYYRNRREKHVCFSSEAGEEGSGPEYCLMCQLRCDNVREHFRVVHDNNACYVVAYVKGVKTLLPAGIDVEVDIDDCCGHLCKGFAFKNRPRRLCARRTQSLDVRAMQK